MPKVEIDVPEPLWAMLQSTANLTAKIQEEETPESLILMAAEEFCVGVQAEMMSFEGSGVLDPEEPEPELWDGGNGEPPKILELIGPEEAEKMLRNFSQLTGAVNSGVHPILPRPEWDQDTAYVAFVIDQLRNAVDRLRQALLAAGVSEHHVEAICRGDE